MFRIFGAGLALAGAAAPAHAEPTAGDILPLLAKNDDTAAALVMAYQNGMDWAITDVEYRTGKNLYCVPPKLSLTTETIVATLRDWVASDHERSELPLGMALLLANEDKYPCPKDKNL